MPYTRNKNRFVGLIDKKFDEFKISLLAELLADIDTLLSKEKDKITNFICRQKGRINKLF